MSKICPKCKERVLIFSRKWNSFYRPNSAGYTVVVHEAGRYEVAEAEKHLAGCDHLDVVTEEEAIYKNVKSDAAENANEYIFDLRRQLATVTKERDELKAQDAIHWKTRRALLASNKALADELSDHEKVVEMTIAADLCGIERWQAATGKELTHPDKGQLVTWLLEQWDASKAEVERLKAERYLPIDCPNCGRRRLCYWPEKNECECDKCGYSTEAAARDAKENSDG